MIRAPPPSLMARLMAAAACDAAALANEILSEKISIFTFSPSRISETCVGKRPGLRLSLTGAYTSNQSDRHRGNTYTSTQRLLSNCARLLIALALRREGLRLQVYTWGTGGLRKLVTSEAYAARPWAGVTPRRTGESIGGAELDGLW